MASLADLADRHDPSAYNQSLPRRPDSELPFHARDLPDGLAVMLDATFYIHRLQDKLAPELLAFVAGRAWVHSAIACAELIITLGALNPQDTRTAQARAGLEGILAGIDESRAVAPSPAACAEAAMIAGILARTQHLATRKPSLSPVERCCEEGLRRKLILDCLIFLSAVEQNAILVSANVRDMDLLLRFRPEANVLLYRVREPRR